MWINILVCINYRWKVSKIFYFKRKLAASKKNKKNKTKKSLSYTNEKELRWNIQKTKFVKLCLSKGVEVIQKTKKYQKQRKKTQKKKI